MAWGLLPFFFKMPDVFGQLFGDVFHLEILAAIVQTHCDEIQDDA